MAGAIPVLVWVNAEAHIHPPEEPGRTQNRAAQLLLTLAPFGSKENNQNSFLLSLQDTTEMQSVDDEEQKVSGDVVFNAHIEKLLMFIEKNLDDFNSIQEKSWVNLCDEHRT